MKKTLLLALCLSIMPAIACTSKKSKLAADTLVIAVDPVTVSVSTGAAKSLTAICKSASSSDANISPSWTVDSNLGSFSPKSGKTTTFTAGTAVGTGKIYATYSGVIGTAKVTISSGASTTGGGGGGGGGGGTKLVVYSDSGLGTNISLQEWNSGSTMPELLDSNGCSPDPQKYYKIIWGITGGWDVWAFASSVNMDLTSYTNLCFYIKGASGGETVTIGMQDNASTKQKAEDTLNSFGYTITTSWQLVQIPLSSFKTINSSLNLSIILDPVYFSISGGAETIYIDYIYLQ